MSVKLGGYSGRDGKDWFPAKVMGSDEIERIPDPEGGEKIGMPTAVPSPFARFDLVKTAFENINKTKNLRATFGKHARASKDDERTVSHTLDLAGIVFNYCTSQKIDIIRWNKNDHIAELKNSIRSEHRAFADSLELYLQQDKKAYNFDRLDSLFLFRYDHREILGSTSPVTLFCPSANNLSRLNIQRSDQKTAFGNDLTPLYERGAEFQKWLYFLMAVFRAKGLDARENGFYRLHGISEYLEKSLEILRENQDTEKRKLVDSINEIQRLQPTSVENEFKKEYEVLSAGNAGSVVDILSVELSVLKKENKIESLQNSDFVINSPKYREKYAGKPLPLVLQSNFTRSGFRYDTKDFAANTPVPIFVDGSWKTERTLPGIGIKYQWLTVSDFLEPYIVRTLYPISNYFLAGGNADKYGKGFLLPLKKDFFEFFTVGDLINGGQGKPKISIETQNDDSVKVSLKIPIQKADEFITFERIYKKGTPEQRAKEDILDGGIILDKKFGISLFPFVKTNGKGKTDYRVQLVDADKGQQYSEYKLGFYAQNDIEKNFASPSKTKRRFNKKFDLATSDYYEFDSEFDFIQLNVTNPDVNALIIPKWKQYVNTSKKFTFAVDFGTTNTFIAYKENDGEPIPLSVSGTDPDISIATLFDVKDKRGLENIDAEASDILELIDREFVPREFGKNCVKGYGFPQRTAIAYNSRMSQEEWDNGLDPLTEANIPFGYEKIEQKGNLIDTNIKWNSSTEKSEQFKREQEQKVYLKEIILLLQNKVLANGGNLNDTKLIWFYPNSMRRADINILKDEWEKYFSEYFLNGQSVKKDQVIPVLESLAPFYAQKGGNRATSDGAIASVDIGGGTTDVAIFVNGKLRGTTSFKFAGNALFGDGYLDKGANESGFVLKYAPIFHKLFSQGALATARIILDGLLEKKRAADVNAFLFSVESSVPTWKNGEKGDNFSFTNRLKMDFDLKFLLLYFYVSLVYHIAKIIKEIKDENGNLVKVRYLMFSGNGSKFLPILSKDDILNELTQKIFEDLGLNAKHLEINLVKNPKEATCYGGLIADIADIREDIADSRSAVKFVYTCIKEKEFSKITYKELKEHLGEVESSLKEFHQYFFELNKHFDFSEYFAIPNKITDFIKTNYENILEKWLADSINKNQKIEGIKDDDDVTETPFFMPLKSIILELSKKIAENKLK